MRNQKAFTASKSIMDARKLLSTINQGYAGQSKILEQRLEKLGDELGRKFRLVSAHPTSILFQDSKSNNYYKADYKKDARSIVFENIQQIEVVDEKKAEIFGKTCLELVEAIEENSTAKIDKAFQQLEYGHCTPNVIPESGFVRTRDGNTHRIMTKSSAISEEVFPLLSAVIKEAVKESKIVIKEGSIRFQDATVKLPVSELTRRQVVARRMRTVAESAYKSANFQRLIKSAAGLVSKKNIPEAIKLCKGFLAEQQEFTLLDQRGFQTLIENTLYSVGIFNYALVRDTARLLWESNCHINKADIIKEWRTAAEKTKIPAFVNNVVVIEDAAKKHPRIFSEAYDRFLKSVLVEDQSSKAVKAQAYLNMLKLLKNVVAGSDADMAVQSTVDDLVMRLESDINGIDDALLYEVEDLLATTSTDLVHDVSSLGDFDKVPEPQPVDAFGGEEMVGEFDGDMGDGAGGMGGGMGGAGGAGGGLGADLGAPAGGAPEVAPDAADMDAPKVGATSDATPAPGAAPVPNPEDEKKDPLLDLAHIMRTAKPVNEMAEKDVKAVAGSLRGMKPEALEEGDKEFKALKKKDLSEAESIFVKAVIERAKALDSKLHDEITEAYFDVIVGALTISEEQTDTYSVMVNEIEIDKDYKGTSVAEEWEKPWLKKDKEEGKSDEKEEGKKDDKPADKKADEKPADKKEEPKADDKPAFLKTEAKKVEKKDELPIAKDNKEEGNPVVKAESKTVDEAVVVVSTDDDAKMMSLIAAVLDNTDGTIDDGDLGDTGLDDGESLLNDVPVDAPIDGAAETAAIDGAAASMPEPELEAEVPAEPALPAVGESPESEKPMESVAPAGDAISEDNDITDPESKKSYTNEENAKKDGEGDKRNADVKFSQEDYDGTGPVKTGKDKPNAGLPSATKE